MDFQPEEVSEQLRCIDVSVIDDATFEETEQFFIIIEVDDVAVSLHVKRMSVLIHDDDRVTLTLKTPQDTVLEGEENVTVCVQLSGRTEKIVLYNLEAQSVEGEE